MGNVKRYYWLKLMQNFFNQREIKKLRKVAGGDTFTIIYLKMQLFSLNESGKILFAETESNIIEQLSIELDEELENIKLTVNYLKNNNLIEINETQDITLIETKELIGSETDIASRVRKHRAKTNNKKLQSNTKSLHSNTLVTKCNTEIEKEIEKEIERELDTELRLSLSTKIDELKTKWNKFVSDNPDYQLAKCKIMSDKLKKAIKARLNEKEYDYDEILEYIPKQPFLLGNNDRNWKVNFNFTVGTKWANILTENFYPKPRLSRFEQKALDDKKLREKNDKVLKEMLEKC